MENKNLITKAITDITIKICFDTVEFTRLYEQENSESAKRLFECNEGIKKGLKWFIGSENSEEMRSNIAAYINAAQTTLHVYNSLTMPFNNKEKLIATLSRLHTHLIELELEVKNK